MLFPGPVARGHQRHGAALHPDFVHLWRGWEASLRPHQRHQTLHGPLWQRRWSELSWGHLPLPQVSWVEKSCTSHLTPEISWHFEIQCAGCPRVSLKVTEVINDLGWFWLANIWQLIHPAIYSWMCWHVVRWARCLRSNIGGVTINDVALDFWHSGQNREDIGMEDLEHRLRAETMDSQGASLASPQGPTSTCCLLYYLSSVCGNVTFLPPSHQPSFSGGFAQSDLMSGHLIDFYVPFLPLEYRHVKLCARDAFTARGMQVDEATLDEVAKAMLYVPKEERLFSAQGCKSIPQRINFFLP